MIAFKRYIRPGLIVSVIFHLGVLIVALLSVRPNAFHAPPPDAMVVELVTMDELPRFEGTLSNLHSSGSETPSPANGKGPVTQAPPPKPRPQTKQETQQPPQKAQEARAPPPLAPEGTQAELVRTEKAEPEKQNKSSERQPAASPPTEQSPQQPNIA
jgi:outer membrane biosynthesis protein TonB